MFCGFHAATRMQTSSSVAPVDRKIACKVPFFFAVLATFAFPVRDHGLEKRADVRTRKASQFATSSSIESPPNLSMPASASTNATIDKCGGASIEELVANWEAFR